MSREPVTAATARRVEQGSSVCSARVSARPPRVVGVVRRGAASPRRRRPRAEPVERRASTVALRRAAAASVRARCAALRTVRAGVAQGLSVWSGERRTRAAREAGRAPRVDRRRVMPGSALHGAARRTVAAAASTARASAARSISRAAKTASPVATAASRTTSAARRRAGEAAGPSQLPEAPGSSVGVIGGGVLSPSVRSLRVNVVRSMPSARAAFATTPPARSNSARTSSRS